MCRAILRLAVVVGAVIAVGISSAQATGAAPPVTTVQMSSAQTAACDGAHDKTWVEISGLVRTIYYTNCRDVAVARQAYIYDLVPVYLRCQIVPPNSTVSWTTSFFQVGWGITTC